MSDCKGIGPHLDLTWGTRSYFALLGRTQAPSRLVTVYLGTLWSSIKQVKAPYMFDGRHEIALHALQGNQASSRGEGEVSCFFSSCCGNLGYIVELSQRWPFKTHVCSVTSRLLSSSTDTSRISPRLGREIGMLLEVRRETQCPFQVATGILIFLSIFKKSQASSPFEALNSAYFPRCQRNVKHNV